MSRMPPPSRERLAKSGRISDVGVGERLFEVNETTEVYFPLDCVISLTRDLEDGEMVEVGMVGPEGLLGVNALLGVPNNPHTGVTQGRGLLLTVPVAEVRDEMQRNPETAALLLRFAHTMMTAISQQAACNRRHNVEQRLAHWLLLLHDRVGSDEMSLTHEFLSYMLATRRAGITEAMGALSEAGAIERGRNRVRVLSRTILEKLSCECYAAIVAEYERVFGFLPRARERATPID